MSSVVVARTGGMQKRGRKIAVGLAAAALVVLAALQFVPVESPCDNPPVTARIDGPAEIVPILERSCFDCHSNETRWPWYARVAPASWLVTADVAQGRARLNFSDWENLSARSQRRRVRRIVERVENGEMPMWQYLLLHPGARPDADDIAALRRWRDALEEP